MKIKRLFLFSLIILGSIFLLSGCQKEDKITIKSEKTKFYNLASDYNMTATYINTYFIDGSDTRYVNVSNFMSSLKGFYRTEYLRKKVSSLSSSLNIFFYGQDQNNNISEYSAKFDWNSDKITVNNKMFFNIINQSDTTNYIRLIEEIEPEEIESDQIVFDLPKFGFNIYYKNGKVLVPFSIMNLIFCSQNYYNIYYNGDAYYGTFYSIQNLSSNDQLALRHNDLNESNQSDELREETYNFIRFALNYYYGLKEYKEITDIDKELESYKDGILSKSASENNSTYYDYFITHLDELHTRVGDYSFYDDYTKAAKTDAWDKTKTSPARLEYLNVNEMLTADAKNFYSNTDKGDTKIGTKCAMILVPSFTTGTDQQISGTDAYLYDTYEFIKKSLDSISSQNIKNIIIDLSLNGGGNVGALIRTLGFISNESIPYYTKNYLDGSLSSVKFNIDINNDGNFKDNDAYDQYNWYVLTSFNTFSAANSFAAIAKELGAKTIGQKTGGGMCSVMPIVLPDQTTIEMSSNNAQLSKVGDKLELIEAGVNPDITINYSDFYNLNTYENLLN